MGESTGLATGALQEDPQGYIVQDMILPLGTILKKERGFPKHLPPAQTHLLTALSLPVSVHAISFPTLPHAYPTPHFSKPRPNPFPPPWITHGSSQHHRSLLGMYPSFFFLVCNSACMCVLCECACCPSHPHGHIRFLENKAFLLHRFFFFNIFIGV